ELAHRQPRNRCAVGRAMNLVDEDAAVTTAPGELEAQPALAYSGVSDHADDLPVRLHRSREDAVEPSELCVPSDQARETAKARSVEPRAQRADALELEDTHWSAHPLHRTEPTIGEHKVPLDQPRRVLREQCRSRCGQSLGPCGEADA